MAVEAQAQVTDDEQAAFATEHDGWEDGDREDREAIAYDDEEW